MRDLDLLVKNLKLLLKLSKYKIVDDQELFKLYFMVMSKDEEMIQLGTTILSEHKKKLPTLWQKLKI